MLDLYLFSSLSEVREITESWIRKYNEERPYQSLGKLAPAEYGLKNQRKTLKLVGTKIGKFTISPWSYVYIESIRSAVA